MSVVLCVVLSCVVCCVVLCCVALCVVLCFVVCCVVLCCVVVHNVYMRVCISVAILLQATRQRLDLHLSLPSTSRDVSPVIDQGDEGDESKCAYDGDEGAESNYAYEGECACEGDESECAFEGDESNAHDEGNERDEGNEGNERDENNERDEGNDRERVGYNACGLQQAGHPVCRRFCGGWRLTRGAGPHHAFRAAQHQEAGGEQALEHAPPRSRLC